MRRLRSKLAAGAAIGGAAVGGAALANAATTSTTTTTSSPSASTPSTSHGSPPAGFPAHGTSAHEDAEKPVTGTAADKAKAAAVKSVGSGTAGEVTTDFTGKGYEVTVTKPDGSKVEIHLDSSLKVMKMPAGGHGPHGGPPPGSAGGAPPGGAGGAPPAGAGGTPPAGYAG